MTAEWESLFALAPGSIESMGRDLRAHHGKVMPGLDDTMIALLEKLSQIPWEPPPQ